MSLEKKYDEIDLRLHFIAGILVVVIPLGIVDALKSGEPAETEEIGETTILDKSSQSDAPESAAYTFQDF